MIVFLKEDFYSLVCRNVLEDFSSEYGRNLLSFTYTDVRHVTNFNLDLLKDKSFLWIIGLELSFDNLKYIKDLSKENIKIMVIPGEITTSKEVFEKFLVQFSDLNIRIIKKKETPLESLIRFFQQKDYFTGVYKYVDLLDIEQTEILKFNNSINEIGFCETSKFIQSGKITNSGHIVVDNLFKKEKEKLKLEIKEKIVQVEDDFVISMKPYDLSILESLLKKRYYLIINMDDSSITFIDKENKPERSHELIGLNKIYNNEIDFYNISSVLYYKLYNNKNNKIPEMAEYIFNIIKVF